MLGHTAQRRQLLRGLLAYRAKLRASGVAQGLQWINGSFAEQLNREPNDIDVVTFCLTGPLSALPPQEQAKLVFPGSKAEFRCDAYFVELSSGVARVLEQTTYWYGLFSHRRATFEWKGLVEISLDQAQDALALADLNVRDAAQQAP